MVHNILRKSCLVGLILGILYISISSDVQGYEESHVAKSPPLHEEIFEYEPFTVRSYIVQSPSNATFSYIIKLIERGNTPRVALEFGNTPFDAIVVNREYVANTKFVHFPTIETTSSAQSPPPTPQKALPKADSSQTTSPKADSSQTTSLKARSSQTTSLKTHSSQANPLKTNDPKAYIVTTYTYECTLPQNQTTLDIGTWKMFALLDNQIFSIVLTPKTLTWTPNNPEKATFWQILRTGQSRILIVILAVLAVIIAILGSIRIGSRYNTKRKAVKKLQNLIWTTIQQSYKEQNIENLYYQPQKIAYFQAVKQCLQQTLVSFHYAKPLPPKITQKLMNLNKKLDNILQELTEYHLTHPSTPPAHINPSANASANPSVKNLSVNLSSTPSALTPRAPLPKNRTPTTPTSLNIIKAPDFAETSFLAIKQLLATPFHSF